MEIQQRYLRERAAAEYCAISHRTLQKLRRIQEGPRFLRPTGRRLVVYERADLDAWLQNGRQNLTTDAALATTINL